MYEQPNAPASIGGVLDSGFKLFRSSFMKVVGLTILAGFIGQITNFFMTGNVDANGVPQMTAGLLVAAVVTMLLSAVFYGAVVGRIHGVHAGRELSIGESFGLGLACMLPLIGCFILYGLAVVGGSILLLIPGLILAVSLIFAPYMIIIDRVGVIASLKQSHKLVWGHWWRTTAILGIAGFIMMVAYLLVGMVVGVFLVMNPESLTTFSLTQAIVTSLMSGLITPLFYALSLAAYYDLKLRREGGDLAAKIEAEPSAA